MAPLQNLQGKDVRAFSITLGCAIVWVASAFLVAYPEQVFRLNIIDLSGMFMGGNDNSRLYIPLLVIIDVFISFFVGHYETSQRGFRIIICAAILYVIIAAVPLEISDLTPSSKLALFSISAICLLIIRTVSFYDGSALRTQGAFVEV